MTTTPPTRRAVHLTVCALATGSALTTSTALAASSTTPLTYRGPVLDKVRVVVQVSIVVLNNRMIEIRPTVFVRTARSQVINAQVVPLLTQEALQAQSARIQVVSGATITSLAYMTSLQAAIRRARQAQAL